MGSFDFKAGYANEDSPSVVVPACVGYKKAGFVAVMRQKTSKVPIVGWDALTNPVCDLKYPMDSPEIDWQSCEQIWSHVFYNKMAHRPESSPVLVAIPILASNKYKMALLGNLFEELGCERCYIATACTLPLRSLKRRTGLVIDSGHSGTWIVPVYENVAMINAVQCLATPENRDDQLGGRAFIQYVLAGMRMDGLRIDNERNYRRQRPAIDVVQRQFYVAMDPEVEQNLETWRQWEQPVDVNDQVWHPEERIFTIPEKYFQASVTRAGSPSGRAVYGIDNIIVDTIRCCEPDVRKALLANIVLAGACGRFAGFAERLQKEVQGIQPYMEVSVTVAPTHSHFAGAVALIREIPEDAWINYQEWEEQTCLGKIV